MRQDFIKRNTHILMSFWNVLNKSVIVYWIVFVTGLGQHFFSIRLDVVVVVVVCCI